MKRLLELTQIISAVYLVGIMGSIELARTEQEVLRLLSIALISILVCMGALCGEKIYKKTHKKCSGKAVVMVKRGGYYDTNPYDGARHVEKNEEGLSRRSAS